MKINIGTLSPVKIQAIEDTIADYEIFRDAEIQGLKVSSGVTDQPTSLNDTVKGAKTRAKNAFMECDLSFGIESGLMKFPGSKTGYVNASVCAIYDGRNYHLGMASTFEYPKKVTKLMLTGIEGSEAMKMVGYTDKKKIGYAEGTIGFLTKGKLLSVDYYKPAIASAIIQLENPELY